MAFQKVFSVLALGGCLSLAGCPHDHEAAGGVFVVTVSGEATARSGFPFSASGDDAFVDGWELHFDRVLVTLGKVTLSEDPDTNPTDQSQTGAVVATLEGPWAVDLTKTSSAGGATATARHSVRPTHEGEHEGEAGAGVDPGAAELGRIETLANGDAFDAARRYALGYEVVRATAGATKVAFDESAAADYETMIAQGQSMLYVGTATFRGTTCTSSDPTYDFTALPREVHFRFGFATPARYVNCQNSELTGQPFAGEEKQRGVQLKANAPTYVQLTFHTEHPFFDTTDHEAARLFFDQVAAASTGDNVTLEDLAKVDFTAFRDGGGRALPWRSCVPTSTPSPGQRAFSPGSVPVNRGGSPESALRHYADYMGYLQSTQGHLNADGLCGVARGYPSPP